MLIALFIGFRYEVGGDWFNYEDTYILAAYDSLTEALVVGDPAYGALNWLGHAVGAEIWFVNLACAAIFAFGLRRFAAAEPNPWLSILVGIPYLVIVVAMGYTRQAAAIGFVLAGLAVAGKTSLVRFAIYIVLATLFHKTALFVLPLVALSAVKRRGPTIAATGALGLTLYYLFLESSVEGLMVGYIEAQYASEGAAIRVAMNLVPALLFLFMKNRFNLSPNIYKLWRNFAFAAVAMLGLLLVLPSSTVVDRLALYLIPLQLFVLGRLPLALSNEARPNAQILLGVIIYSGLVQFVWLTSASHAEYWLPYKLYPIAGV